VAVKEVLPSAISRNTVMGFVGEMHILSRLKHVNVVECVGAILGNSQVSSSPRATTERNNKRGILNGGAR
jgi:hypothetical protein